MPRISPRGIARASCLLISTALCLAGSASAQTASDVVATVDGQSITLQDVDREIAPQLQALQQQIYVLRKSALESAVDAMLLRREAARRGLPLAELRRAMSSGDVDVSEEDVEQVYQEHLSTFLSLDPNEARERVRLDLETKARVQLYRARLEELRKGSTIALRLDEPRVDDREAAAAAPSLGDEGAPVLITEFGNFECAYCRSMEAPLRELLRQYGGDVRFVYRQLPFEGNASSAAAAQAAVCAGEQGKFWEFRNALYDRASVEPGTLTEVARAVGLDTGNFDRCRGGAAARQAVNADVRDAKRFGITGTPTLIVNGRVLRGRVGIDELRAAVEQELNARVADAAPQGKGE